MAQYDGSIRIGTGIDTKGLKDGKKELEAESKKLGESVSKSVNENIQIDSKKIENALDAEEKRIEKLAQRAVERAKTVQESVPVPQRIDERGSLNQGYDKNAIKFIDEYAIKTDEHFNQLRIDVEEYSKTLKELQNQGKFFGDEDYDKVYLAWKNATDAVRSYQAELNKQTTSGQEKIAEQEARAAEKREAAQRRAEEQAERALQKENARIQKQVENEAKVSAKEEEKRAKEIAAIQAQEEEEKRIAQIRENAVVGNQRIIETVERIKQLEQEIVDLKKAGVTEGYKDYEDRIQELSRLRQEVKDYNASIGQIKEKYKKLSNIAKSSLESIRNVLKKANSAVNSFGRKIREVAQNHLRFFRKEAEKTKSSLSGFAGRLKSLALSLLIFNQISAAFRKVSSSISSGFKNLYEDNERFRSSIDGLKASVLTLENAFAAAFRPIVDMAVPYIEKLVEWLTHAVNLAGQFIAALTGRKTYTRAIKQTAKASGEAAGAAKEEAEAEEEKTDAINKQLSPLDKLNNLSSEKAEADKNNKKDKDKLDAGGAGGIMFEEVPIEGGILDMVDKFKDIMSKLFAPLKEAWNREGKFVMDSWKYALDEIWKLVKDIGRDFLTVWQQPKTVDMFADILHIIGDIGLIVGHLARNFRDAWNENKTGLHILENIRDILAVIIHNIRLAADFTVEWADKLDFSPILEAFERFSSSLIPVADALSGVLMDFYTMVLLPLGKWTLEKGLPELLDVFTSFNEKVDWKALRNNLAEFWEHLEPFAETVGEGLIIFIRRVSDALADFINSDAFVNFLHTIEDWMDSVTPEDVADGIERLVETLIGLKLVFLSFEAIKGISGAFATIKAFLTFFGVGGAGAAAAKGIEETTTALGGLVSQLALVGGSYYALDQLTEHLEEVAAATGHSTDQARRLEARYDGLSGKLTGLADGFNTVKNGIQGYGFAADNCVGQGIALEKAMNDIAEGAILTDAHMSELQNRFNLTDDDMEMLRQAMLDANPLLREFADNMEFENASAETLEDIAQGFRDVANGAEPTPLALQNMTEEAQNFFNKIMESDASLDAYREKLENIGSVAENASEQLNLTGKSISDGITKGMEEADVDTASQGFFTRIVDSIKDVFGIHSPAENMKPIGENIMLGVIEGFKDNINQFSSTIQSWFAESVQPWFAKEKWSGLWDNVKSSATEQFKTITSGITAELGNVQTGIQSKLVAIRTNFTNVFNGIRSIVIDILNSLKSTINSILSGITSQISSLTRNLNSNLGGTFRKGASRVPAGGSSVLPRMSAPTPYAENPAFAALSKTPIPKLATGAVIPANREFLAVLGDQKRGTNIEAPLDTIKQAQRESILQVLSELGLNRNGANNNGAGNTYEFSVDGQVFFRIMEKYAEEYKKQHGGKPAFT